MNFGGGLVGGDHIDITVFLGDNCAALVTTQESTKVSKCKLLYNYFRGHKRSFHLNEAI